MARRSTTPLPPAHNPDQMKKMILRINADGGRALKVLAAEKDTTLVALAVEAFNDLLKKHGKRPVVSNPLKKED